MLKQDIVNKILGLKYDVVNNQVSAFAPVNIALCKYWGKRDDILNLPVTDSLSVSLANLGTTTELSVNNETDQVYLDNKRIVENSDFFNGVINYIDLFRRDPKLHFTVKTWNDIPTKAGLASSASGFCALASALNTLFSWDLDDHKLSIIARLGSGSASRSIANGFVYWHAGKEQDGMDSYGEPLSYVWPELMIGIITVSSDSKAISSREAMACTTKTSTLYQQWPKRVSVDIENLLKSLKRRNIALFGETAESNALGMHATMLDSKPSILYWLPETVEYMKKIWKIRHKGIHLYFTIDAGPNIKLIYEKTDEKLVREHFPGIESEEVFG